MTDPNAPARDPAAGPPPAAGQQTATAQAGGTGHPRGRRRWMVSALAVAVAAGLAAGLAVWAPWVPPPVLRPAGLKAGPVTATSITLRWSRPPTGPLPDRYLILINDTVAGSAAGTATSHRLTGLTPASPYDYRMVAVRGGTRSPASAGVTATTLTPPVSAARLQGTWIITGTNLTPGGRSGDVPWRFTPVCTTGACTVTLHGSDGLSPITVKLARTGAAYQGQATDRSAPCGSGASATPRPIRLTIRLHVTAAAGITGVWAATALTGSMTGTYPYVSAPGFYCPASRIAVTLHASKPF